MNEMELEEWLRTINPVNSLEQRPVRSATDILSLEDLMRMKAQRTNQDIQQQSNYQPYQPQELIDLINMLGKKQRWSM